MAKRKKNPDKKLPKKKEKIDLKQINPYVAGIENLYSEFHSNRLSSSME